MAELESMIKNESERGEMLKQIRRETGKAEKDGCGVNEQYVKKRRAPSCIENNIVCCDSDSDSRYMKNVCTSVTQKCRIYKSIKHMCCTLILSY